MESIIFSFILLLAIAVLTQPLWRKWLLKKAAVNDACDSTPTCATKDCTNCPLPQQQTHLGAYIEKKYPRQ